MGSILDVNVGEVLCCLLHAWKNLKSLLACLEHIYIILFCNEFLVLNTEIRISRLLGHKVLTACKVASYLQENTNIVIYIDYSFKYVYSKKKKLRE